MKYLLPSPKLSFIDDLVSLLTDVSAMKLHLFADKTLLLVNASMMISFLALIHSLVSDLKIFLLAKKPFIGELSSFSSNILAASKDLRRCINEGSSFLADTHCINDSDTFDTVYFHNFQPRDCRENAQLNHLSQN
jgi:hypothetical protein